MQKKVTVIVSVYNGEQYLKDCLDSIKNQDYENIEVFIIDDGSNDNSASIISAYSSDPRFYIINQNNCGVSKARNNGIKKSSGDYICFVDQDDILSPHYISYLLNLCENNNAEISLTPRADVFFDKPKEADYLKLTSHVITGLSAMENMLYHKYVIAPWNKMISRDLILSNGIWFQEPYFNGEGFAFSIECFQAAKKVVVGNQKIYHYRVGDPNTGASVYKEKYVRSSIDAQKYILSTIKSRDSKIIKAWSFSNWHTHCDCFNIFIGCGAKKKNLDLYRDIKKVCRAGSFKNMFAPVSLQQRFRAFMFFLSPVLAAKIINLFRYRKFKKVE